MFREKVGSNLEKLFDSTWKMPIRKVFKKKHNCNFTSDVLWKQKNTMFKILNSVVYCIMDIYACVDYIVYSNLTLCQIYK